MTATRRTLAGRDLKQRLDREQDIVLINVLPEEKFSEGHIPDSENVPSDRPSFVQDVTSLVGNKDREIVVYCGGGRESSAAADALMNAGFTNVEHFSGGMREWKQLGYPVESGLHSESRR